VGTVVAIVGQPDERVRHGLVVGPSLDTSLLLAVVGSLAGALIVVCLVSVFAFLRYRLADDANWLCYSTVESGHSQFWIISNMPRFDVGAIGSLYGCVKLPSGPVQVFLELGISSSDPAGRWLTLDDYPQPVGHYHVRWYLTPPGKPTYELKRAVHIGPPFDRDA
jgi:hypothetical protein